MHTESVHIPGSKVHHELPLHNGFADRGHKTDLWLQHTQGYGN